MTCFVEKAGFEPRTLGTKAERYNHCATRQVVITISNDRRGAPVPAGSWLPPLRNREHLNPHKAARDSNPYMNQHSNLSASTVGSPGRFPGHGEPQPTQAPRISREFLRRIPGPSPRGKSGCPRGLIVRPGRVSGNEAIVCAQCIHLKQTGHTISNEDDDDDGDNNNNNNNNIKKQQQQ